MIFGCRLERVKKWYEHGLQLGQVLAQHTEPPNQASELLVLERSGQT